MSNPLEICGLPDVRSGNETRVLWKSSCMNSQSLSLYFSVKENDNFGRIHHFPEHHFKVSNEHSRF